MTKPRLKTYYIRMENVGYYDVKVKARNKKEARQFADENQGKIQCECAAFETGEVSTEPITGYERALTENGLYDEF